jgi:hypothetical protein
VKNEKAKRAPCGAAQKKILQQCIQIGVLQLVITWQQLDPATDIENRKETNMQEMTNFTHPIELSNEELDLVAAGTGGGGGGGGHHRCCGGGNDVNQFGLINLNDVNVGVNILGIQAQG